MYAEQLLTHAYHYYNADYLGNNRDVVRRNGSSREVLQRTEYGSFGTPYPQDPAISGVQAFKYNGKEFDKMHGLNWYGYDARMQDPILNRFHTMGPLAEKYYSVSPYAYCANNPVRYTDPNGKWIVGTNGGPVTYSLKNGFSPNASADVIRIGSQMAKTETGLFQLVGMINHDAKITMGISSEVRTNEDTGQIETGLRTIVDGGFDEKGNFVVTEMDITIYEGSIDKLFEKYNVVGLKGEAGAKEYKEMFIGAIGVHEAGHTEAENVQQSIENKTKGTNHDVEKRPDELMHKHRKELEDKK